MGIRAEQVHDSALAKIVLGFLQFYAFVQSERAFVFPNNVGFAEPLMLL
jgi:hypothetical protein